VLLDTEPFYTEVARVICRRFGKSFDPSVKARMLGRPAADSARILIDATGLPLTPAEYLEVRRGLLDALFAGAEPMPGAPELTRHLAAHGVGQAVATSSDRRTFELKTARHRAWFGVFSCIVLGDDPAVARGKPAPDIFLAAAARLGAEPAHCLVFEDAPAGIAAARAAGMAVVALPDLRIGALPASGADANLPSLEAFDPAEWGLPPRRA
jgi:pseudouridine-5'-monophosphatase